MKTTITSVVLFCMFFIFFNPKSALAQFDYFQNINKGSTANAVGYSTTATGQYSTATGYQTSATGYATTAIGNSTSASGTHATAIGYLTVAPGWGATALGQGSVASGSSSVAIGYYSETTNTNQYGIAIGSWNTAAGMHSKAIGTLAKANGESSVSMGVRTNADAYAAVALGRYNVGGGSNTWVATDPLFEIGIGTAENARANAMTVFKDGKVNLSYLQGVGSRMVVTDASGNLSTQAIPTGGDNLGNHIATQNINLNSKWLSGNGTNNGISIAANGGVTINSSDVNNTLSLGTSVNSRKLALYNNPADWYGLGMAGFQMRLQVGSPSAYFSFFGGDNQEVMRIKGNGFVGIGTTNPQSMLAVKGKITTQEVEVTMNGWADFVFNDDYKLRPLAEVEKFIKTNKHLPDVPSEIEVLKNGVNLGEMNATLLQKIEELTLYLIDLKKQNEAYEKRIKALEAKQ